MALNKSVKTPGSRSGYLSEMTASSSGNPPNFLLPVRIKVTPTNTCPLSDGKKNSARMLQPVLIKDLLSSHKDRNSSTIISVSTQKKKPRTQRLTQPYLNTQSCYKPKHEEDEEAFSLSRKSFGGSRVRRQLYQTLDSPQKFGLESKESSNKTAKPKKKKTSSNEESESKSTQIHDKGRKSLLLPPNSIKNSFISKSEINSKASIKHGRRTISNVSRQTKGPLRAINTRKSTAVVQKSTITKAEHNQDVESDCSTPDSGDRQQSLYTKQDKFTMTSPAFSRGTILSKSASDLNKLERPSVIMNPSNGKSALKNVNNTDHPNLQMQNLNIGKATQSCSQNDQVHMQSSQKAEFDFSGFDRLDSNNLTQFKSFLEQSIEACETQLLNLKQVLSFVNTMLNNNKPETCTKSNESPDAEKLNASSKFIVYHDDESDATDIAEKSMEMKNLTLETDLLSADDSNNSPKESAEEMPIAEKQLPLPIKMLVSDVDLKQEATESLLELFEMARLSTIGEVSRETEYECENKENQCSSENIIPVTPKMQKSTQRRSSCESANRRRSARLAAKRLSTSESDNHDSFTRLENELNVECPGPIPPSKSLPASPMKSPTTPGVIKQWDKKVERPLKEYMALKMNGSFLVTPDVKRFQSCLDLGPTDTPHSRKSLSRKIFMELCDLYGESPES